MRNVVFAAVLLAGGGGASTIGRVAAYDCGYYSDGVRWIDGARNGLFCQLMQKEHLKAFQLGVRDRNAGAVPKPTPKIQ